MFISFEISLLLLLFGICIVCVYSNSDLIDKASPDFYVHRLLNVQRLIIYSDVSIAFIITSSLHALNMLFGTMFVIGDSHFNFFLFIIIIIILLFVVVLISFSACVCVKFANACFVVNE